MQKLYASLQEMCTAQLVVYGLRVGVACRTLTTSSHSEVMPVKVGARLVSQGGLQELTFGFMDGATWGCELLFLMRILVGRPALHMVAQAPVDMCVH
jgi:hypothetical protein